MQHMPAIVPSLDFSIINSDNENENAVFNGHFIWDYKMIMLFFTEYEQHEEKLKKKIYQSKEAIQAIASKENAFFDVKQDVRTKMLTELQKCNELQKERNIFLQKQLQILEKMAERIYLTEKESSDEEL
ncbi:hypothetical protein ALC62_03857 [Cyphomyrmex costatus]|uniref:Uncharacterized protein n=1 Tax=Cyphomyrmex costatus TaxID=456900 RepID=A0A151IKW3_9HYME|nr:hypothetical protein ALC62_03857 [Cyphomyrmex costatus]